jgi:signal transduction histidine kinase
MGFTDEENPTEQDRLGSNVLPIAAADAVLPVHPAADVDAALSDEHRQSEQLRRALRASEESLRRVDDLIAMVSHDLRSPLSSIQLNVQSILRSRRSLPRWVRLRLLRVEDLVRHTAQLINDLLVMEQGSHRVPALRREELDLTAFVRQTVALLGEQIEAARSSVRIHCDGPVIGHWDRVYLRQIVANLVTNAIKYGAGKPFEIAIGRHPADGAPAEAHAVSIVVSDHGIGIPDGDHQRIFDRFEQLRPTDPRNGVGLGLWIVAEAAHRLHGTVRLRSAPGQGSTFIVELPDR